MLGVLFLFDIDRINSWLIVKIMADKLARAEKSIESNPFDLEAWGQILREAQLRKIDDARAYFERLIEQFPTSGRYWKMYIEQEMRARNYAKVEKVRLHFIFYRSELPTPIDTGISSSSTDAWSKFSTLNCGNCTWITSRKRKVL